ncbi:UDP-glucose/GDP-mannose dehydrogenase family protein [Cohnella pontilimi]|uniref:UDP-glucose 6-dehydrogenase n=1 Tax=Cohnella pontilimi TaxID=2564100 RepID=A0A4U0FI23_9BACL|nr:UDP-glucose/GDP-mannose dehydrogenase family protein [Cohnella pontilimi]TJY43092.1 UDP-glucose/GDP-mannose dehydrogenase family protein [Cohnella pontilimi]
MNVACIGAGYVGSVTAAALAVLGHAVTIIDIDEMKLDNIRNGKSPIYEPGLEELIRKTAGQTLSVDTQYESVGGADVVFICVGTPSKADMSADLTFVKAAAARIGKHLNPERYTLIVMKSTVPVGTTDMVTSILEEVSGLQAGLQFETVSNPEFLREGYAVEDVFYPDRIVVGSESVKAEAVMKALYLSMLTRDVYESLRELLPPVPEGRPEPVWLRTTPTSAELIKYASNAFLAVKISYINEMARLCDRLGSDITEVAAGMGLDSRIGNKFLQVSSGWSGSCFPKDTAELLATARKYDCDLQIVTAAVRANHEMHIYCVKKVQSKLKSLQGKRIGVLGLTFKPNTDDARKSQAEVIIRELCELGSHVKAHDPHGAAMFRSLNPDLPVEYCDEPERLADKADALILLTHWDCYLTLDWANLIRKMRTPYVLDTRNALHRDEMLSFGYDYEGLGI